MSNKIRQVWVPSLCVFICIASFVLDKQPHVSLMLVSCCLLIASVILHEAIPRASYVQLVFLAMFHWSNHLNWSQPLYIVLIFLNLQRTPGLRQLLATSISYSLLYTLIRLSYVPPTKYNILVSFFDLFTFVLMVVLFLYLFSIDQEKQRLKETNSFLITHDPLTKLLNYDGYVGSVQSLIRRRTPFVLVLLDFPDFRSMNQDSKSQGNEILVNVSLVLKTNFPHALAYSRYAGDRFAMILPQLRYDTDVIQQQLKCDRLGYDVTHCMASYPQEASSTEEIIALAEDRLFQSKRVLWLKREEDLFRAEKMNIVGELAAGLAHEIRNPLTTMKGFMQLSKSQSYSIEPWFDIIMNEITRMNELTTEFLQFSKPHISNMKPESISACMERAAFLTESQALSRGHRMELNLADEALKVHMDRDKLVQVLLNLVRNGMEAMTEPGVLTLSAEQDGPDVVISIMDTGSGISEKETKEIFQPFYTTREKGTGLGLSVSYKIVKDHGGTLSVKSEVGKGSVFFVRLPLIQSIAETY